VHQESFPSGFILTPPPLKLDKILLISQAVICRQVARNLPISCLKTLLY